MKSGTRVEVELGSEGFTTQVMAGNHRLISDEPREVGGADLGPSPYEYVLAGLGACTVMTLRMYAKRKGWRLEGATVELEHSRTHAEDCRDCATEKGLIDRIESRINLVGDLSEEQRERLLEIAERCPVHRTLTSEIWIETSLLP